MDLNRIELIGRVGVEPKLSTDGTALNFSVATNEGWTDKKTGELKKKATWHNVAVFGPKISIAQSMIKKGSKIWMDGKLTTYEYLKDNVKMFGTSINLREFIMLDGKPESVPSESIAEDQSQVAAQLYNPTTKPSLPGLAPFTDDEIPF